MFTFNYIITIHNKEHLIRKVLNGVKNSMTENSVIYPVLDGCTDNTEHVIDEFQRVALAHENLEFSLFHDDDPVFRLRKGSQMQRIVDIFGRKLQPQLIPIKEDIIWCKLHGFVAKPERHLCQSSG